jgi:uncharacterized protein YkwD
MDVTAKIAVAQPQQTTQPPQTPQPQRATKLSADTLAEYADEVFRMVNEAREQAGLPLLERTDEMDEAAAVRAGECASRNSPYVNGKAHTRPDGSSFSSVLTERDISWRNGAGENSASGQKTSEEVMGDWIASSGHKANILSETWSQIGISVRKSTDGTLYWIQLFV